MKIVVKKANQGLEVVEIPNSLEEMQKIVGGYIQTFPLTDSILCVCNEEGKLKGLSPNFMFCGDVVVGDVFFCSADREDFGSLTEEQIEVLMIVFRMRM